MAAEYESVQVSIESESTDAAKKVNDLAVALSNLKKSVDGLSNMSGLAKSIESITKSAESLSSISQSVKDLSTSLSTITTSFTNFADKINGTMNTLNDTLSRVTNQSNELNQTVQSGGKGGTQNNLEQQAQSAKNAAGALDFLREAIARGEAQQSKAYNSIDKMTDSLEAMRQASGNVLDASRLEDFEQRINDIYTPLSRVGKQVSKLRAQLVELEKTGTDAPVESVQNLTQGYTGLLRTLQNTVSVANEAMKSIKIERSETQGAEALRTALQKANETITDTETKIRELNERIEVLGSGTNLDIVGQDNIDKLRNSVRELQNQLNVTRGISQRLTGTLKDIDGKDIGITNERAKTLCETLNTAVTQTKTLAGTSAKLVGAYDGVKKASEGLAKSEFKSVRNDVKNMYGNLSALEKRLDSIIERFEKVKQANGFDASSESAVEAQKAVEKYQQQLVELRGIMAQIGHFYEQVADVRGVNLNEEDAHNIRVIYNEIYKLADAVDSSRTKMARFEEDATAAIKRASESAKASATTGEDIVPKVSFSQEKIDAIKFAFLQLKTAMQELEAEYDTLNQKAESLKSAKGFSENSETAKEMITSISKYSIALEEAKVQEEALKDAINQYVAAEGKISIEKVLKLSEAYSKAAERANKAAEAARKVVNGPDESKTKTKDILPDIYSSSSRALEAISTGIRNVTESGVNALYKAITRVSGAFKSLGKTIISGFTAPFQAATKTFSGWVRAIGRISFYRMFRSAIKAVTDGIKFGIDNIYQYSQLVGSTLAPSMDKIATSAQYLKNSLGAMAAPLIEALAPAIDYLIDKFVALINVIGKVFALLTGKGFYTQAKKQMASYGDTASKSVGGAADKAKELKNYLLGIDELNVIDPTKGAGGGGGGGGGGGISDMFEEVPIEGLDWVKDIKDAIEKGNWFEVGRILADKLNEVVEKWQAFTWGELIGKKINQALEVANGFLRRFRFDELGSKFADLANGIIITIRYDLIGDDISALLEGILDTVDNFVKDVRWDKLGEGIANIFNNIRFYEIISKFAKTVTDSVKAIKAFLDAFIKKLKWDSIAKQIYTAINDGFIRGGLDWKGIGKTLSDALDKFFKFLTDTIDGIDWVSLGIDIAEFLNAVDWDKVIKGLVTTISTAINGITTMLETIFARLEWKKIADAIFNGLKLAIEKIEWIGLFAGLGSLKISNALVNALLPKEGIERITESIKGAFGAGLIAIGITLLVDSIHEILVNKGITFASLLEGAAGGAIAGGGLGLILARSLGNGITWQDSMLTGAVIGTAVSLMIQALTATIDHGLNVGNIIIEAVGGAIAGGMIGFKLTKDLAGGMFGAVLGLSLSLLIQGVTSEIANGVDIGNSLLTMISGAIAGGLIGAKFSPDTVMGGIGGIIAGLGLSLLITGITHQIQSGVDVAGSVQTILGSVLAGAGVGFTIGGPVGAAVGAAVGLVVGVGIELIGMVEAGKHAYEASEEFKKMANILGECNDITDKSAVKIDTLKQRVENLGKASNDFYIAKDLVNSIYEINENTDASTEDLKEMAAQVQILNGLNLGSLHLSIDETTGRVIETKKSVDELIASLEQEAKMEALRELVVQSTRDQVEAMRDYATASQDLNTAQEALAKTQDEMTKTPWWDFQKWTELNAAEEQQAKAVMASQEAMTQAESAYNSLGGAIDYYKGQIKDVMDGQETTFDGLVQSAQEAVDGFEVVGSSMDTLAKDMDGYGYNLGEGLKNGADRSVQEGEFKPIWLRIANWFKSTFKIGSPSKLFDEYGGWIGEGLYNGVNNSVKESDYKNIFQRVSDAISTTWDNIKTNIPVVWDGIKTTLSTTWDKIKEKASDVYNGIEDHIKQKWSNVETDTSTKWDRIGTDLSGEWDNMQGKADTVYSFVEKLITGKWSSIEDDTKTKWTSIEGKFSSDSDSIQDKANRVYPAVESLILGNWKTLQSDTESKWSTINKDFSSNSDSIKNKADTVYPHVDTLIRDKWNSIDSNTRTTWNGIDNFVNPMWEGMKTNADTQFTKIESNTAKTWGNIHRDSSKWWKDIANAIQKDWADLVTAAIKWGQDICKGIADGIKKGISVVTGAVKWVAQGVRDFIGFSEPKKGPLSDFHTYMPDMLELMASGIRSNSNIVYNEIDKLASGISEKLGNLSYSIDFEGVNKIEDIESIGSVSHSVKLMDDREKSGIASGINESLKIYGEIQDDVQPINGKLDSIIKAQYAETYTNLSDSARAFWAETQTKSSDAITGRLTDTKSSIETMRNIIDADITNDTTETISSINGFIRDVRKNFETSTSENTEAMDKLSQGVSKAFDKNIINMNNSMSTLSAGIVNGFEKSILHTQLVFQTLSMNITEGFKTSILGMSLSFNALSIAMQDGFKSSINQVTTCFNNLTQTLNDLTLKQIDAMNEGFSMLAKSFESSSAIIENGSNSGIADKYQKDMAKYSSMVSGNSVTNYGVPDDYAERQQQNTDEVVSALSSLGDRLVTTISASSSPSVYLDGKVLMQSVEKHQRQRGANIMAGGVMA